MIFRVGASDAPKHSSAYISLGNVKIVDAIVGVNFIISLDHVDRSVLQLQRTANKYLALPDKIPLHLETVVKELVHRVIVQAEIITSHHIDILNPATTTTTKKAPVRKDTSLAQKRPQSRDWQVASQAAVQPTPRSLLQANNTYFHNSDHRGKRNKRQFIGTWALIKETQLSKEVVVLRQAQQININATNAMVGSLKAVEDALKLEDKMASLEGATFVVTTMGHRILSHLTDLARGIGNARAGRLSVDLVPLVDMTSSIEEARKVAEKSNLIIPLTKHLEAYSCLSSFIQDADNLNITIHLPASGNTAREVRMVQVLPGPIWTKFPTHVVIPVPQDTLVLWDGHNAGVTLSRPEFERVCFKLGAATWCEAPVRYQNLAHTCAGALAMGKTEAVLLLCPLAEAPKEPKTLQITRRTFLITAAEEVSVRMNCKDADAWSMSEQNLNSTRIFQVIGAVVVDVPDNCILQAKTFRIYPPHLQGRVSMQVSLPVMEDFDIRNWNTPNSERHKMVEQRISQLNGDIKVASDSIKKEANQVNKAVDIETLTGRVLDTILNDTSKWFGEAIGYAVKTEEETWSLIKVFTHPAALLGTIAIILGLLLAGYLAAVSIYAWAKQRREDAVVEDEARRQVKLQLKAIVRELLPEFLPQDQPTSKTTQPDNPEASEDPRKEGTCQDDHPINKSEETN